MAKTLVGLMAGGAVLGYVSLGASLPNGYHGVVVVGVLAAVLAVELCDRAGVTGMLRRVWRRAVDLFLTAVVWLVLGFGVLAALYSHLSEIVWALLFPVAFVVVLGVFLRVVVWLSPSGIDGERYVGPSGPDF